MSSCGNNEKRMVCKICDSWFIIWFEVQKVFYIWDFLKIYLPKSKAAEPSFLEAKLKKRVSIRVNQLPSGLDKVSLIVPSGMHAVNCNPQPTVALLQVKSFKVYFFNCSSVCLPIMEKNNSAEQFHRGAFSEGMPRGQLHLGRCASNNS